MATTKNTRKNTLPTANEISQTIKQKSEPDQIDIDMQYFPAIFNNYVAALMQESSCDKISAIINTLSLMSAV